MTNDQTIREATQAVLKMYGSLESPNFRFQKRMCSSRPYEALIQELGDFYELEETTDMNDDVSFRYSLSESNAWWSLELSMIASYAVILRTSESTEVVSSIDSLVEQRIASLLNKYQIELLPQAVLEHPIALSLQNTEPENVTLFQALFSDVDVLPWR